MPLPAILALRWRSPRTTSFMEARKAELRAAGKSDLLSRSPVPAGAVAPELVTAVLAAEDARFFRHRGVDWQAVREAAEWNRKIAGRKGRWRRGGSTITQQLAKNLWLSPDRSLFRKGREAAIAIALDALVPKEKVLEHYLSAIEWGERVFGAEAASRLYFGVSAARLSAPQAAWLAAMIPGPTYYLAHPEAHRRRAALIEARAFGRGAPLESSDGDEPGPPPG